MTRSTEITIEEGSTNVYADLGYADAAEMQRKSHSRPRSPGRSRRAD